jgi:hypothetical protein
MKVVLRKSLKGTQVWIAGTVFDSSEAPIPPEVLYEVRAGSSIVEVLSQGLAPPSVAAPPVSHVEFHQIPETWPEPLFPEPEMPPPLAVEKEEYHYGAKKESRREEGKAEEGSAEEGTKEPQKVVRRVVRK